MTTTPDRSRRGETEERASDAVQKYGVSVSADVHARIVEAARARGISKRALIDLACAGPLKVPDKPPERRYVKLERDPVEAVERVAAERNLTPSALLAEVLRVLPTADRVRTFTIEHRRSLGATLRRTSAISLPTR